LDLLICEYKLDRDKLESRNQKLHDSLGWKWELKNVVGHCWLGLIKFHDDLIDFSRSVLLHFLHCSLKVLIGTILRWLTVYRLLLKHFSFEQESILRPRNIMMKQSSETQMMLNFTAIEQHATQN
jgi:hypothetical protein